MKLRLILKTRKKGRKNRTYINPKSTIKEFKKEKNLYHITYYKNFEFLDDDKIKNVLVGNEIVVGYTDDDYCFRQNTQYLRNRLCDDVQVIDGTIDKLDDVCHNSSLKSKERDKDSNKRHKKFYDKKSDIFSSVLTDEVNYIGNEDIAENTNDHSRLNAINDKEEKTSCFKKIDCVKNKKK